VRSGVRGRVARGGGFYSARGTTRKTAIGGTLTRSAYSKWCAAAI
jgi:hypothetical protein